MTNELNNELYQLFKQISKRMDNLEERIEVLEVMHKNLNIRLKEVETPNALLKKIMEEEQKQELNL